MAGHGSMVRSFLEDVFLNLDFSSVDPDNVGTWTRDKLAEWAQKFLFACIASGDTENYPFFVEFYSKMNWEQIGWADDAVIHCLKFGTSSALFATVMAHGSFPHDFDRMLTYAFDNPKSVMLDHLISITPTPKLLSHKSNFVKEFETREHLYRDTLNRLQLDPCSKGKQSTSTCVHKRLLHLKFILINVFKVEWDEYRPIRGTYYRKGWD